VFTKSGFLELAAREVFELMLGCQLAVAGSATLETLHTTSMVGLAGQLCGVLSLRCSAQSAMLMASKMLGKEPKKDSHEMWDALGEVCNNGGGQL
jgi:CheY-specific phosphatase CheX